MNDVDFGLTSFALCPSSEEFNRCRKKGLIEIADFFHVNILRDAFKQVRKEELFGEIVNTGVLDEQAVVGTDSEAVVRAAVSGFDLNLEGRAKV